MTASVHEFRPRSAPAADEAARRAAAMRAHPSAAHKAPARLRLVDPATDAARAAATVLPLRRPGGGR